MTPAQVTQRAMSNVRERSMARAQFGLIHESMADVPTLAFQSREGWASALLLMPDQLARVFGDRPGLILTPMRDVIFQLPLDVDRDFAHWLQEELCALDVNALDVPPYAFLDGELRVDAGTAVIPTGRRH